MSSGAAWFVEAFFLRITKVSSSGANDAFLLRLTPDPSGARAYFVGLTPKLSSGAGYTFARDRTVMTPSGAFAPFDVLIPNFSVGAHNRTTLLNYWVKKLSSGAGGAWA